MRGEPAIDLASALARWPNVTRLEADCDVHSADVISAAPLSKLKALSLEYMVRHAHGLRAPCMRCNRAMHAHILESAPCARAYALCMGGSLWHACSKQRAMQRCASRAPHDCQCLHTRPTCLVQGGGSCGGVPALSRTAAAGLHAGLHNTAVFLFFLGIPYLEYGIRNTIRKTELGGSVNGGSVAAVKPTNLCWIDL